MLHIHIIFESLYRDMYVCCVFTQLSADSFMRQDVGGVSLFGLFGSGGQHWTLSFLESESAAHAAPRHFHLQSKQLSAAKSLLSLIRPVVRRRHQSGAQTTVTSWLADYACLCLCVCVYVCDMFNMFSLALLVFLLTCMQICSAVVCGNGVWKKVLENRNWYRSDWSSQS